MLAALLVDVATDVGAIVGALLVLGALARTRPARWVFRQLVAEPAGEWLDARITKAVTVGVDAVSRKADERFARIEAELTTNGGESLKDCVVATREELRQVRDQLTEYGESRP